MCEEQRMVVRRRALSYGRRGILMTSLCSVMPFLDISGHQERIKSVVCPADLGLSAFTMHLLWDFLRLMEEKKC